MSETTRDLIGGVTTPPGTAAPVGIIPPNVTPVDAKKLITDAVNKLVPLDKHAVVVGVFTERGMRFASAQRVGAHLQFFEEVSFAHGSDGKTWSGQVGLVGEW